MHIITETFIPTWHQSLKASWSQELWRRIEEYGVDWNLETSVRTLEQNKEQLTKYDSSETNCNQACC